MMIAIVVLIMLSYALSYDTISPQVPNLPFMDTNQATLFTNPQAKNIIQEYGIGFNQFYSSPPKMAVMIQTIESQSTFYQFCFLTNISEITHIDFKFTVQTCNDISLSTLRIQYLVIDPSLDFNLFIKEYQFYNISDLQSSVINLEVQQNCSSLFGGNYQQNDVDPQSWASWRSLQYMPANTSYYSMNPVTKLNCQYPEYYFTLSVRELFNYDISNTDFGTISITNSLIIYIKVTVIATKGFKYLEEIKITTFYSNTDSLTNQKLVTIKKQASSGYLIGIAQFCTESSNTLGFGWDMVNQTDSSITLSAIVNWIGPTQSYLTISVGFNYQVFSVYNCSIPYIYYNSTSGLCQDGCENGSYLSFDTYTCIKCHSSVCIQCNSSNYGCVKCNDSLGYIQINDMCVCLDGFASNSMKQSYECKQICGDGKVFTNQCDDGNTNNGDGCSSNCTIENNSFCVNGTLTSPSICTVLTALPLTIVSFTKQEDANAFIIQLASVSSLSRFLTEADNSSLFIHNGTVFQLNFAYESVTYNSAPANHLSLRIAYSQSLNNQTLSMTFVTDRQELVTVVYPSVTDNNLALKVYSNDQYSTFLIFKRLMPIFSYIVLAFLIFTFLLASKLIAIETLFIFQFAYGGLIMLRKLQPLMYTFKQFWIFNGYNRIYLDEITVPARVSVINYQAEFLANFNIQLIIFFLPILLGTVILFFNRLKCCKKIQRFSLCLIVEWEFSAILFCLQQLVFSFGLNILYSNSIIKGVFIGSLLLLTYIIFAVLLLIKYNNMPNLRNPLGEYRILINRKDTICKHFYVFVIGYRLILSITMIVDLQTVTSESLVLAIVVLWTTLLIWKRPYLENVRPIINSFVMLLLSVFFLYCRKEADSPEINFATFIPIAVICMLGLSVVVNVFFSLKRVYQLKIQKQSDNGNKVMQGSSAYKTEESKIIEGISLDFVSAEGIDNTKSIQPQKHSDLYKSHFIEQSAGQLSSILQENIPGQQSLNESPPQKKGYFTPKTTFQQTDGKEQFK